MNDLSNNTSQRARSVMEGEGEIGGGRSNVYLEFNFSRLCRYTVSLPLVGLVICFVSANIVHYQTINNTFCKVRNFIPSISAITGVSPQRYLWRICIAFHVTPRILVASVYHSYYKNLMSNVPEVKKDNYSWMVAVTYWLNMLEVCSVVGVTYVSNKENYPVHEKIFVVFMMMSTLYMIATLSVCKMAGLTNTWCYKAKRFLFVTTILSTLGLVYFFWRHRFFCEEGAFSWFSLCEYWLAVSNMAFHMTVVWDFPEVIVRVGDPIVHSQPNRTSQNMTHQQHNKVD